MKRWMGWMVALVLLGTSACAAARPTMESEAVPMAAPAVEVGGGAPVMSEPAMPMEDAAETNLALAGDDLPDRMIIYNGSLSMVVPDPEATASEITGMVDGWDGYIASSSSYAMGDGLMRIEMSLRVPAEHFNEALNHLRTLSDDIRQDSVSSSDVTEEYIDLDGRLRALEAKAERLEELMDQAEDTEAVLAIFRELSETQQEIEQVKGRMRYLERRSAMATIDVTLLPKEAEKPIEIGGWEAKGVAKKAIQALIDTYHFFATVVIWLVIYLLPVGVLLFLVAKLFYRLCRRTLCRNGRKRREKTEPPTS